MLFLGSLLSCLAFTAFASGQAEPSYELTTTFRAAEAYLADTKLLSQAALMYTTGEKGIATLKTWARGGHEQRSQAARLVLLNYGGTRFLPLLLEKIDPPGTLDASVAFKAVELHSKEAWPILVRLAEGGNRSAALAIGLYKERGGAELLRLAGLANAKARAVSMPYIRDKQRLIGALEDPDLSVRRYAVQTLLSIPDFNYKPYLSEKHKKARALFAELAPRWVDHDLGPWLALKNDKSVTVRKWALLHYARIGLEWGHGPHTSQAIQAVHDAFVKGPPELYHYAAMAVRGWLLEWHEIDRVWSPSQIAAARAIFRLPKFRDAVYYQTLSEKNANGFVPVRVLGIQMQPAMRALILSQDKRALPTAKKVIDGEPAFHKVWIEALGDLPGPATVDYLFRLIEKAGLLPSDQDYVAREIFEHAFWALQKLRVKDWSRTLRVVTSPRLSAAVRSELVKVLAPMGTANVASAFIQFASEENLDRRKRNSILFGMTFCAHPSIGSYLQKAAQDELDPGYRRVYEDYFREWQKRFQRS